MLIGSNEIIYATQKLTDQKDNKEIIEYTFRYEEKVQTNLK